VFSVVRAVNIGQALAAPSFDRPTVLNWVGGRRDASRCRTGRCNVVRDLATYCGWRFEHDHPRAIVSRSLAESALDFSSVETACSFRG
jgi:hypothetical protein